jgi:hypothetical protein
MNSMEPTMHSYIDSFIQKMKEVGNMEEGVDLQVVSAAPAFKGPDYESVNIYLHY